MGWIIHYADGKTLAESQDIDWVDIPKENVTSLQITHKGIVHSLVIPKNYHGIFQHKIGWSFFGRPDLNIPKSDTQIGVVLNDNGDCVVVNIDEKTGHSKIYIDNVIDMKMNLQLHGIRLNGK